MSYRYENLSPDGHESMTVRIFQKIKNWVETVFQVKAVTMNWNDYKNLTPAEQADGSIRFLKNVQSYNYYYYDESTKTLWFAEGVTTYDDNTKTFWF